MTTTPLDRAELAARTIDAVAGGAKLPLGYRGSGGVDRYVDDLDWRENPPSRTERAAMVAAAPPTNILVRVPAYTIVARHKWTPVDRRLATRRTIIMVWSHGVHQRRRAVTDLGATLLHCRRWDSAAGRFVPDFDAIMLAIDFICYHHGNVPVQWNVPAEFIPPPNLWREPAAPYRSPPPPAGGRPEPMFR